MVSVELPFGELRVRFQVRQKNLLRIAQPAEAAPVPNPDMAVLEAIREPVGCRPLCDVLRSRQEVLVIIDDNTRPTPQHQVLPPLLREIEAAGPDLKVKILIALGTHRAMTPEEIRAKVGSEIAERYTIINHDCTDDGNLVDFGVSPNGTPIKVNRLVTEADLVLGVGSTVPHDLAGWSGGAKIIQPGVCGRDTTSMTHALSMISPVPHLGRLDNPMRQEIEDVARQVPLHFMINVVPNRHGQIVHVVAGEPTASHRKSVELAKRIWMVPLPALADIVVVSSYPADMDYWQGIKGLLCAELAVRRGGDIILVAPCQEGISGTAEHVQSMAAVSGLSSRSIRREAERLAIRDLAAINMAVMVARINELAWVSVHSQGLTAEDLHILGHDCAETVEAGLRRAFDRQGADAKITVITHGGEICPVLASQCGRV